MSLTIWNVSVVVPPIEMLAAPNALLIVGGPATAAAAVRAPSALSATIAALQIMVRRTVLPELTLHPRALIAPMPENPLSVK